MKHGLKIVALFAALMVQACAAFFPNDDSQDVRLSKSELWIKMKHNGPQDHPVSTLLIFDEARPIHVKYPGLFVRFIGLTSEQYESAAAYTAALGCSSKRGGYPYYGQFDLYRSDGRGGVTHCFLSRAEACDFLGGLLELPQLLPVIPKLEHVEDLRVGLRCWDVDIYSCNYPEATREQNADRIDACGANAVGQRGLLVTVGASLAEPRKPARDR